MQDRAILDAYLATLLRIRDDVGTGKLSAIAAQGVVYAIEAHFSEILGSQQFTYLGIVGKPVDAETRAQIPEVGAGEVAVWVPPDVIERMRGT